MERLIEGAIAKPPPGPLALPSCAAHGHLSPNVCLRSPLFGIFEKKNRTTVKNLPVASVNGAEVFFTGFRLNQADFDLFAHFLHLAGGRQDDDGVIAFGMREVIKALDRSYGNRARLSILDSVRRLKASSVEIKIKCPQTGKNYTYGGSFIDSFLYCHEEQKFKVRLNPHIARLFDLGWSKIDWQQRLSLRTDLAKWLHGYYSSSHRKIFPVAVERLREMCGSSIERICDFRKKLRLALNELLTTDTIESWEIDGEDKVRVSLKDASESAEAPPDPYGAHGAERKPAPEEEALREQPLLTIPLIPKDGEFPVYQKDVEQWQELFPGLDVEQHLRRIRQWSADNPTRRKTLGGIRRHITSWLEKSHDRAGRGFPTADPKNEIEEQANAERRRTREYLDSISSSI